LSPSLLEGLLGRPPQAPMRRNSLNAGPGWRRWQARHAVIKITGGSASWYENQAIRRSLLGGVAHHLRSVQMAGGPTTERWTRPEALAVAPDGRLFICRVDQGAA